MQEYGIKVRFNSANSVVISSRGWSGSVARYFTAQFDGSTGNQEWTNTYSQTASDREPLELIVEPTGSVVTAGWRIEGATTNYDYVLVGYTSAGAFEFENIYTTPNFYPDKLNSLTTDLSGNFIVTGESATSFLNNYLYKMVTIKFGGTVVGQDEIQLPVQAIVFPNPSASGKYILVDRTGLENISGAEIYDSSGRLIKSINCKEINSEIDISGFPEGLYLYRFFRDDIPSGVIRLIRN